MSPVDSLVRGRRGRFARLSCVHDVSPSGLEEVDRTGCTREDVITYNIGQYQEDEVKLNVLARIGRYFLGTLVQLSQISYAAGQPANWTRSVALEVFVYAGITKNETTRRSCRIHPLLFAKRTFEWIAYVLKLLISHHGLDWWGRDHFYCRA